MYLCARTWQNPDWAHDTRPVGPRRNIWRRPPPAQLRADGSVEFEGGQSAQSVDVVLCATGYQYTFPFLERAGVVTVEDNRHATCLLLPDSSQIFFLVTDTPCVS